MRIPPELIGFDIDGVVANTSEAFLRIANDSFGYTGFTNSDITEFDVAQCLPIPKQTVEDIFDHLLTDPIAADMQPMPNAVRVLNRMAKNSPITFITARPLKEPIMSWIEYILPEKTLNKVKLIAMGDHDDKARHIKKHKLNFFVDDRAETCMSLKNEGITPIVFNQPWNLGKHDLPIVRDWDNIEKKIIFNEPFTSVCS